MIINYWRAHDAHLNQPTKLLVFSKHALAMTAKLPTLQHERLTSPFPICRHAPQMVRRSALRGGVGVALHSQSHRLRMDAEMHFPYAHGAQLSRLRHTACGACLPSRPLCRSVGLQSVSHLQFALPCLPCLHRMDSARSAPPPPAPHLRKPLRHVALHRALLRLGNSKECGGDIIRVVL